MIGIDLKPMADQMEKMAEDIHELRGELKESAILIALTALMQNQNDMTEKQMIISMDQVMRKAKLLAKAKIDVD